MDKNMLSGDKARVLLKFKYLSTWSNRAIARQIEVSHQTVSRYFKSALTAGLTWPKVKSLDNDELTTCLFPNYPFRKSNLIRPNCAEVYKRLNDRTHEKGNFKKEDYWREFLLEHGVLGVGRTTYYNDLKSYRDDSDRSMTQFKSPGDYFFCDIAGSKVYIGKNKDIPISIFAGAFGDSDLAFIKGSVDETQESWLNFMEQVFVDVNGVPVFVVTDNAAALRTSRKNTKKITAQYRMFSEHYDFIPFDIPIRSPRYNYRAERTVRKFVDAILAYARELTFLDLNDFNTWLQSKVKEINSIISLETNDTSTERFLAREQQALRELNSKRFPFPVETHVITVQKDYKFVFEGGHYSIPENLKGQKVTVIVTKNEVEMKCKNKTVCIHTRLKKGERDSMKPEHMPMNHRVLVEQNKAYFIEWASQIDASVVTLVEAQYKGAGEPDYKARKACLQIQRLAKKGEFDKYVETCQWVVSLGRLTVTAFSDALQADVTANEGLQDAYQLYQQKTQNNTSGDTHYVH